MMQDPHQRSEPGAYLICPLCDELIPYPVIDVDLYRGGSTIDEVLQNQILAYYAELEAILMDHLRIHTAQVILGMGP